MADVFTRNICIRQGAEFREQYQRALPRHIFEAQAGGTSGASAPTFPADLDATAVDNGITWLNKGLYVEALHADVTVWLPSTAYARRARVVSPIVPVDLTGYTGAFQLRLTIDAATPLHSGVTTFGTRANGEFSMVISTADAKLLDFDACVYDHELSNASGEVDLVVRGEALLVKEVTRD